MRHECAPYVGWGSDFLDGEDAVHGLDRALDLGGDGVLAGEVDVDLAAMSGSVT